MFFFGHNNEKNQKYHIPGPHMFLTWDGLGDSHAKVMKYNSLLYFKLLGKKYTLSREKHIYHYCMVIFEAEKKLI